MVNFMNRNKVVSDDLFILTKIALEKPVRLRSAYLFWFLAENDISIIESYLGRLPSCYKIKSRYGSDLFKELCKNLYYLHTEIN